MRQYLIPEGGNFYKAALHCHSTLSDGKLTPEQLKEEYKKRGYSVVAYTDHELIHPHTELEEEDFLPITAYEIAINESGRPWPYTKTYHLNLYFRDKTKRLSKTFCEKYVSNVEHMQSAITDEMRAIGVTKREYSKEFVQWVIDTAKEEGAIVSYNHPVWSLQNYSDYSGLRGFFGVEWHNSGCVRAGYPDTVQPIIDLLAEGERKCYPLATDDIHHPRELGFGWLMIKAPELSYDAIFNALEAGEFYSSAGPEIKELYIEDGVLHIKSSGVERYTVATDHRITERKIAAEGEELFEAEIPLSRLKEHYELSPDKSKCYFRIDIMDKNGRFARTRAFFLDELEL